MRDRAGGWESAEHFPSSEVALAKDTAAHELVPITPDA